MSGTIKNILIVDDNRLPRMMERSILNKNFPELTIHDAGTDDEALQLAREHSIDLALLDINMPGMGGMALAAQMKEESLATHLCFISANIQNATQEQAKALGAHFIAKPISEEKLVALIHEMDGGS